jgi:hypothetical protein
MIRFYAPIHAVTVDVYKGTRQLVFPQVGHEEGKEPRFYEAGTVYEVIGGGLTAEGLSFVDVRVNS